MKSEPDFSKSIEERFHIAKNTCTGNDIAAAIIVLASMIEQHTHQHATQLVESLDSACGQLQSIADVLERNTPN